MKYFEETNKFIQNFINGPKKKAGVLVHCRMGKSRSATIICAYLMKNYKMSY